MYSIENEFLTARFKKKGAELYSLTSKKTQTEFMWNGNPEIWGWSAPVLFPIIGGLKNDTLFVNKVGYSMTRHGFFRKSVPIVESQTNSSITFLLTDSDETKKSYPFSFEFRIRFELDGSKLKQTFEVTNTDTKSIFFALGGHPAFKVPFFDGESYSDYFLEFEQSERLDRHLLNPEGLFSGETEPILVHGNKIPLTYSLFEQDALVFKEINSRRVTIKSKRNNTTLSVHFPDFPYLGLWSKPGANYVCIEPWIGCADSYLGHKDISDKEFIQDVLPGETFTTWFSVEIDQS